MSNPDFLSAVEAHPDLAVIGRPKEGVVRLIARNGRIRYFDVDEDDIANHEWDEWCAVLFGKRQPRVMRQYTRVVGYYSNIANWNRSKLAELRDRHKGNYQVTSASGS